MTPERLSTLSAVLLVLLSGTSQAEESRISPGQAVFIRECAKCHQIGPGARNRIGPQLNGLFGRKAGTAPGFDHYSPALRNADFVWTPESVREFIRNPKTMIAGTSQVYKGLKDDGQAKALLDFLKSNDQPEP